MEKNSISVHMNELRPVEECEVCVTPFYRLLWALILGNCEDCGNIGVDHVCVLVCHYCHIKCSSAFRNLWGNSAPLLFASILSFLLISQDTL